MVESWIKNLRRPYLTLLAEGVVPNLPCQESYPASDWIEIELTSDIELSF